MDRLADLAMKAAETGTEVNGKAFKTAMDINTRRGRLAQIQSAGAIRLIETHIKLGPHRPKTPDEKLKEA